MAPQPTPVVQQPVKQPLPTTPAASSFEDIFFSDTRPPAPVVAPQPQPGTLPYGQPVPTQPVGGFGFGGLELLGGGQGVVGAPVAPVGAGFGGMNLLGGPSVPLQPSVQPGYMGGLNFGINPNPQVRPPVQATGGFDLLGGLSVPTGVPAPAVNSGLLGFGTAPTAPTANLGFNLLGPQQTSAPTANFLGATVASTPAASSFRAYENQHLEINMKCSKEANDTASIVATFSNKTGFLVENLVFQVAVMKHLKLVVNPLNSTSMQPYARESVHQVRPFH